MRHIKFKKHKIITLVLIDLLCICIGLNLFALFHIVLDFSEKPEPYVLPTPQIIEPVQQPASEDNPDLTAEPDESAPVYSGMWGEKFHEFFTDGEIISTDTSYKSENISVSFTHVEKDKIIYNIAEIYISDLKYLKAGLGGDDFRKQAELILDISSRLGAIVSISGDHFGARQEGPVVRNGILYRETEFQDVCIITNEGEMITLEADEFNIDNIKETGVWQVWSFGPELLDEGQVKTEFNSNVTRANPRSAIGYVEPGHYFFVQVDGRIDASRGMTMSELSQLFYDLGCTAAYNLDGGQTAGMTFMGSLVSYPYRRPVWDIIYIGE